MLSSINFLRDFPFKEPIKTCVKSSLMTRKQVVFTQSRTRDVSRKRDTLWKNAEVGLCKSLVATFTSQASPKSLWGEKKVTLPSDFKQVESSRKIMLSHNITSKCW